MLKVAVVEDGLNIKEVDLPSSLLGETIHYVLWEAGAKGA